MTIPRDTSSRSPEQTTPGTGFDVSPEFIGPDGTWPMPPGSGPCRTWPLDPGCGCLWPGPDATGEGTNPADVAASWTPEQRRCVEVATEILWRATAGRFGLCEEIIRPCRVGCASPDSSLRGTYDPTAFPVSCQCGSTSRCGCSDPDELVLPGPVYWEPLTRPPDWRGLYRPADRPPDIGPDGTPGHRYRLTVWVDGMPLYEPGWPVEWVPGQPLPEKYTPHPGQFWLYGDRLVRTDGGTWPVCQDLSRPLQPRAAYPNESGGTFGIQYWRGLPVPPAGRRAVAVLACELWKACRGDSSCRLPQHVQSITREGVSYTMVDLTDFSAGGKTGLPDVDMWITLVNPHGMRSDVVVDSVDLPEYRSEWTTGGPMPGWW